MCIEGSTGVGNTWVCVMTRQKKKRKKGVSPASSVAVSAPRDDEADAGMEMEWQCFAMRREERPAAAPDSSSVSHIGFHESMRGWSINPLSILRSSPLVLLAAGGAGLWCCCAVEKRCRVGLKEGEGKLRLVQVQKNFL